MKLIETRVYRGPSPYGYRPVIRLTLDLEKLRDRFKELKGQLPDAQAITLQAEDGIRYEDLVRIIDECKGDGLPQVSVAAAMG